MSESIKPPIGVSPHWYIHNKRIKELSEAITRYSDFIMRYVDIKDEQGYRKIPDDAVVLTKEECEHKVILDEDHFERALNYEREKARKETAKEILNIGKKLYKMSYHKSNAMPRLIEWIKAEYGVEVEE